MIIVFQKTTYTRDGVGKLTWVEVGRYQPGYLTTAILGERHGPGTFTMISDDDFEKEVFDLAEKSFFEVTNWSDES